MSAKVIPVKVAVRCRPLIKKEESEGCQICVQFVDDEPQLVVGKDKAFTYDYVFRPDVDQSVVYIDAVKPLVEGLFKGYNATVLAYGQTGSGKTHSMGGGSDVSLNKDPKEMGIIPRVIQELFAGIGDLKDRYDFTVKVSYLELYKEDLNDLLALNKKDKEAVMIRDDVNGSIKLSGVTEQQVHSCEELLRCLEEGSLGRTTGSTAMNNQSSRSHAIFTILVEKICRIESNDLCKAKFHMVDLAGSERIKKTHAEGERLKEGININKGLLALGNVISALGEETSKKSHIPYRDSKLTRLLQDSLGGNSHTLMVACISPADSNLEETINTLRYADRARKIKNKPVINRDPQTAEVMKLRQLVQDLQSKVAGGNLGDNTALQAKIIKLEAEKEELLQSLDMAVKQGTHLMERLMHAETLKEKMDRQLNELHHKLDQATKKLYQSLEEKPDDVVSQSISILRDAQETLNDIHSDNEDEEEDEEDAGDEEKNEKECDEKEEEDDNKDEGNKGNHNEHEDLRTNHVKRQAQLSRELQDLNYLLLKKQQLVSKVMNNDVQMNEMKMKYEQQSKEMEGELEKLHKEKDELMVALQSVKANRANQKLAEERRKKVQELENQISLLKKKMTEQNRMIKMKEQSEKQVEILNNEIRGMKQQRVKLLRRMKDDSEQFRKLKNRMDKQVMQLKSQGQKRQAEMVRMERQHQNQQAVLRRKAEEASAANNRLKEVLLRQRKVADNKVGQTDVTGAGSKARRIVKEELDFMLSVEEARLQLKEQLETRKELNHKCSHIRDQLNKNNNADLSGSEEDKMVTELKDFESQMNLCTAQISELQQKLMDVDQSEKVKSRWSEINTILEAKCALKWLVNAAVSAKIETCIVQNNLKEMKSQCSEAVEIAERCKDDLEKVSLGCKHEIDEVKNQYENKMAFLLAQVTGGQGFEQVQAQLQDIEKSSKKSSRPRRSNIFAYALQETRRTKSYVNYDENKDNSLIEDVSIKPVSYSMMPAVHCEDLNKTFVKSDDSGGNKKTKKRSSKQNESSCKENSLTVTEGGMMDAKMKKKIKLQPLTGSYFQGV